MNYVYIILYMAFITILFDNCFFFLTFLSLNLTCCIFSIFVGNNFYLLKFYILIL